MNANEAVLTKFYTAFQRRDAKTMAACYAKDATFSDAVFTDLRGAEVGKMWAMLASGAKDDFTLAFRSVMADDNSGSVHWEATYTFSRTGRKVHNVIESHFELAGGKIVRHVDSFSFWRWARQALGIVGLLLGWTPMLRRKVRADALRRLAEFKPKPRPA